MELREFAERILLSPSLDDKLLACRAPFTDERPGEPVRHAEPVRPSNLKFCGRREAPDMPPPSRFNEPAQRAIAHHIMANHEMQALEVMAWVLCAFPDGPPEFRQGLARVMADEQRHTRLHADRAEELGLPFGALPVNGYFWKKAQEFESLLDYIAGLPLTFEGRNLDHTLEFEEYFEKAGDPRGAAILRAIHHDEIRHVAFGLHWLRLMKDPQQSDWDAYQTHLHWPLRPEKARGSILNRALCQEAGMTDEFIDRLEGE